ncbi:MAG: tail fiber domain-containing protein, partial [Deltaproteobacteria bacterium]|nr:tail fiber domain-containing protein [Deltaproteobacteria bacterium]
LTNITATDATKLPLAGGTMTGPLVNNSNSASTALAVTQAGAGYAASFMGGNVGIGTSSPAGTLDVQGGTAAASTSGTSINIVAQNGGTGGNFNGGSVSITGGNSNLSGLSGDINITSGGSAVQSKVGNINITTPSQGSDNSSTGIITLSAAGYGGTNHGGYLQLQGNSASNTGGDVVLRSGNGVMSSGNPGKVSISGGSSWYNTGGAVEITGGAGGNTTGIGGNVVIAGGAKQGAGTVGNVILAASGGNVGIGTTTPQTTLQVAGIISPAVDNTTTLGSATYRFTTVYATNGTINTSDRREKKDIYDTDLGLDFINKLRPVSYRWNTGIDNDVHYGLIAQEAEQVIDEIGKGGKTSIVTHDETTDRFGVRYSELISPLIKAVQEIYRKFLGVDREIASVKAEANAKTAKLEAENAELKARLDQQETELAAIKKKLGL